MARIYRAASYLSRRRSSWYFRFRFPSETQLAANASRVHMLMPLPGSGVKLVGSELSGLSLNLAALMGYL
jgi:hypothetical protein